MNELILKKMNELILEKRGFFYDEYMRLINKKDGTVTCSILKNTKEKNIYIIKYNRISKIHKHDYIVYLYNNKKIKDVSEEAFNDMNYYNNYKCIGYITNDKELKNTSLNFWNK